VLDVYWDIKQASDALNTHLEINHSANGNALTILNNGNVGIGTTNPGYPLEVNGRVAISSASAPQLLFFEPGRTYTEAMRLLRNEDKLSLTYGWNANEEALTVVGTGSTAGYVGIGTTSPDYKFEVQGVISSADTGLQKATFANVGNDLVLTANADATNATAKMLFNSSGASGSAVSTKMIIDGTGNVGIGTTSPDAKLEVHNINGGNATTRAEMKAEAVLKLRPHATNTTNMLFSQVNNGSGMGITVTNGSATANWDIALNPYGGNVGIGTDSPAVALQVQRASESEIRATESATGNHLSLYQQAGTSYLIAGKTTGTATQNLQIYTGNSARMTILSTGNVGIGTTGPDKKLDVEGNIRSITTGGLTSAEIDICSGATWRLRSNPTSGTNSYGLDVVKGGAGTDVKMSITSAGNVGIGTSGINPQDKLHVQGTVRAVVPGSSGAAFNAVNGSGVSSTFRFENNHAVLALKNNSNVVATKISSDGFSWFDGGGVGFGTTTPASPVEMVIPDTSSTTRGGLLLSEIGDSSELDSVRVEYESRKDLSGNPGLIFTPRSQPSSGVWETFFRFKTNGGELVGNKANLTVDGKVGIGTTNDNFASRLTVAKGDIEVTEYEKGLILRSINGTRYRLVVANDGTLTTTAV
jgi:hypothetical protein